jgi:glycosyltransferase involved in cell wall biosynthesis
LADNVLNHIDKCLLIGNDFTLSTFPFKFQNKIVKVPVSGAFLNRTKKQLEFVPKEKEFLWFFGPGLIHKGLDLVLEVFAKNKDLVLNVVGFVDSEKDFCKIYQKELSEMPNIKVHGGLKPSSEKFWNIISKCFCFIAPPCSEGMSPSVVTCLQLGLFPVISRETDVCLPKKCGVFLETCSIEEIEKAVFYAYNLDDCSIINQISKTQDFALREYSRENFSKVMKQELIKVLN